MAQTFTDLGRIEAIRQLFEGSGFDAFKPASATAPVQRVFLEGVDFNLVYFPLKHLGYKAVAAVTGELYAALRHPESLSVVLGVSAKLDYDQISELFSGVKAAAKEFAYKELSLDLQPSRNGLCISVCAGGKLLELTRVRRPKPQSKDLLCVSGRLGAAYLGLQVLERELVRFESGSSKAEEMERYKMLVGAYLRPELPAGIVDSLEEAQIIPSAGVLVTQGLADAVKRISRATGLGAKVYTDKIPFEGNSFELGKMIDVDPVSAAMNGGDDLQLLFCVPILHLEKFRKDFQTFEIIGHLALPEAGTVLVTPEGAELPLRAQGWKEETID